jgi:integrase
LALVTSEAPDQILLHQGSESSPFDCPSDLTTHRHRIICAAEGLWLRAMLELAATFGWRKSSLLSMRVQDVDLAAGTLRQQGSTTKGREGNEVKMTPALRTLITACVSDKYPDHFLFTRADSGSRPIADFRRSWAKATKAAGVPDLHFHDLCRKAARDLDSAGISQLVGMQVMGRKTPSIYKRYRIIDQRDMNRAIDKLVEHKAGQTKTADQVDSQIDSQSGSGNRVNC